MKDGYLTHINEAMNALIAANNMPGIQDTGNNVYIVNRLQNNAFSQGLTVDYKMRHMITVDPVDKKLKMTSVDNQDQYGFDNSTDILGAYRVLDKANLSEGLQKIKDNIGKEVNEGFIFEAILGEKMYSYDQLDYTDKVKKITPIEDMIKSMNESIRNYTLYGKEKAELIAEIKYGNKSVSDIITEYKDTLLESEDKSIADPHHSRGMNRAAVRTIDLYDDDCYNYFDKEEIDYYRNDGRKGEILVETEVHSAIGYIYVKPNKDERLNSIGPFKVFEYYRGKGFGEQLLRDAITKYNANLLKVYKDNEIAIVLYKKVGFKIFKEDDKYLYMNIK